MASHPLGEDIPLADLDRACAGVGGSQGDLAGAVKEREERHVRDTASVLIPARRVWYTAGGWIFVCACGYVSRRWDSQYKAESKPCPICLLLSESRARAERFHLTVV